MKTGSEQEVACSVIAQLVGRQPDADSPDRTPGFTMWTEPEDARVAGRAALHALADNEKERCDLRASATSSAIVCRR